MSKEYNIYCLGIANDKPYEHRSSNGTLFTCNRCDLREPVKVTRPSRLSDTHFAQDIGEFAAYHALHIHPCLNGFPGYDTIRYEIETQ